MCGILGGWGRPMERSLLATLRHRGPDGEGWRRLDVGGRRIVLGHTRLAILDRSPAGAQPMSSRDGRWWISFNGEIYNHEDLRSELDGPFRGHSDTETLIELLAAQGIDAILPRLKGMYAFCAVDLDTQRLYLARDPFGIKPLYHSGDTRSFAFASEVRAIEAMTGPRQVDPRGLKQYLTLRYVPSPETIWQGIRRLPPGHLLTVDVAGERFELRSFCAPTSRRFRGTVAEAVEEYRAVVGRAVRRQLLSDVPVGVFLSGGIDSALVASLAREAGRRLPCFTVGYGAGAGECEIDDARETARELGLELTALEVSPQEMKEDLPRIVEAVEEPLATTSILPMWRLVERTRDDVTVVLTGQGSDEPWGGYARYRAGVLRRWSPWPGLWRLAGGVAPRYLREHDRLGRGLRALAEADRARFMLEAASLFSAAQRRALTGDESDGGAQAQLEAWLHWLAPAEPLDPADRMMRVDARMNLADDLLLYGDKISMHVGLEARVPLLDLDVVAFVESLPRSYRLTWRQTKVVHKAMAAASIPRRIVDRPKRGFEVPFGAWSRGAWRNWVEEVLMEGLGDLLRRPAVEELWRDHLRCRPDRSRQIFALLTLALLNSRPQP